MFFPQFSKPVAVAFCRTWIGSDHHDRPAAAFLLLVLAVVIAVLTPFLLGRRLPHLAAGPRCPPSCPAGSSFPFALAHFHVSSLLLYLSATTSAAACVGQEGWCLCPACVARCDSAHQVVPLADGRAHHQLECRLPGWSTQGQLVL